MPAGILLLASLLSAPAGGQVADPSPSPSPPPEAVAPGTLISSTRTSNTYAAEDGARTTVLFPASVNFKDQGEFVPIDNDLVPVPGTEPGVENEANRYTVRLPDELDSQVRIDRPSGTVGLELVGAAPVQGIVSGDTMSYPDVLPGVTLRYTAANDQVKETIELASPTSPSSLAFRLTPGPGLTPSPNPAGGVDLTDGDGVVVYSILPPWAVDSDHPAWEDPGQVTMALSEDPGGYLLTMTPDPAWLQDPARRWPVLIDPTITIGPPLQDCFVSAGSNQNTSLCAYTQVNVGDNSNGVRRGLVRFDLSAVPVGADISQATLKLYMSSQSNTRASAASLHRATRAWTNAATWNSWDGTSPWTTPGGDFDAVPAASNPQVGDALGWVTWQPTQLVRDWASGAAPNDGVLVKTATEDVGNLMSFTSTDSTDSVHWPVLKVTYTQAAPAPKIAFSWCCAEGSEGTFEIFLAEADGTGVTRFTSNTVDDSDPVVSQDGTRVAFERNGQIVVANVDGTGETQLTFTDEYDYEPDWAPDGSRIVFGSTRDGNPEIYTMNADGSGVLRLTNDLAEDYAPTWSTDGSLIAFSSIRSTEFTQIYVMNADGTNVQRLTQTEPPRVHWRLGSLSPTLP